MCQDYEIAAGEIPIPSDASVHWFDEKLLLPQKAGDIIPGIERVTPNTRRAFADFEIGAFVEFHINQKKQSPIGATRDFGPVVKGTHWGSGIILRTEDHLYLRSLLLEVFEGSDNKELNPTILGWLLRSFWPSRTYVRLFKFGGTKGGRLSEFHTKRMAAVFGKKL